MTPTVVVSIGGSILVRDENDAEYIDRLADMLVSLSERYTLGIVTGGGPVARKYISIAREFGAPDAYMDYIGILATRMNAHLLIQAIKRHGGDVNPLPPENYSGVMGKWRITVMGGTEPGHTTDAVAMILAEHMGAERFVNATNVDGIYSEDPRRNPDARKIDRMSHDDLIKLVSSSIGAGVNVVIDPLAALIARRSGISIYVVNGRDLEALKAAITGESAGTIVEG